MKAAKILYFLPTVIFVLIIASAFFSNVLYVSNYTMLILNLFSVVLAGITLWKGKCWGTCIAIAYYVAASVWDYYMVYLPKISSSSYQFGDVYIPVYNFYLPLIIYYIFCIISIKTASEK